MEVPIIIIGFDRDHYLEKFCASLRAQQDVALDQTKIHFVQDGSKSEVSGCIYAAQQKLDACAQIFRKYFPLGNVHQSKMNLGIALNIERAEKLAFEVLDSDVAYFFEDDMVLGPYYISVLEIIRGSVGGETKIGYFACYGDFNRSSDPKKPKFVSLEHHWGFGLTKQCWTAMQPWLAPFYQIYRSCDYKWRPHLRILRCFESKDVAWGETSQDVAKTAACASLGYARINTDACFARYIGEQGQSFNAETFKALGFDKAPLIEGKPSVLQSLDEDLLGRILCEKKAAMTSFRERKLVPLIHDMSLRMFDPDRLATREDIDGLWTLIMDRLPDSDFYDRNVNQNSVRRIRTELLRSSEARGKSFYTS